MSLQIRQLGPHDLPLFGQLLDVFGDAFDQADVYSGHRPSPAYIVRLLGGDSFIALVAQEDERVVGGIAAYELRKFEQERSEIYIYDLAVLSEYRRQGIATMLIERLKGIGRERGAYVLFVQADTDADDEPAIALYSKLGNREEVLHFDIEVTESEKEKL